MDYAKESLRLHKEWKGKIQVVTNVPVETQEDLSLAYTPGVAQPCLEIQKDIDQSYELTRRWNMCLVVTDGSAVLGLGDIGPEAGMPVMEGKCVLFKAFGDVDAFPLCIKSQDVDEIVNTIYLISGSFGGVNLEDIAAPRCFEIEKKLKEKCDIPIFHDDQHGTAVITLAGLNNAMKLAKKQKENVPISVFLKSVAKNKYLVMFTLINFMYMIVMMSSFGVGQYYFQYVYGNLGTFSIVMAASVALFPVFAAIPKLSKKMGSAKLISGSMMISIIGIIIRMFLPQSIAAQMVGYLAVSLPNIINACVLSQVNYELMEYGRYKTGVVAEGMYSAFISFAQKMATSLNSVIVGLILSGTGFDTLTKAVTKNGFEDWAALAALGTKGFDTYVEGGAATVDKALKGISFAYNGMPLIFLAISIVLFAFFHLERDLKQLRVENGFNEDGTLRESK